jgi:hypothetical protein
MRKVMKSDGTYYGHPAYHCAGSYYQKSGSGYVVVHFD